jgi:hypothetical protein
MKKLSFIIILLFCFISSHSQSCLPEGITFITQAQVDSFQINYPGCMEIEGQVYILGNDIKNLYELSVITSIGEWLEIRDTDSLTSLMGLEGLNSIGKQLDIINNKTLASLTGLEGLTSIGGGIWISNNIALNTLAGLEGLTSIAGDLTISTNNALISLEGLDHIEASTILAILIQYNPSLSICHIESVCAFMENQTSGLHIFDNASGCNSPEEIQDSCAANAGIINEQYITDNLLLYPNPANHELNISPEGFTIQEVTIYTLTGQQVFIVRPKSMTVDISILQPGMYIVEVMVEGRKVRRKLVVE